MTTQGVLLKVRMTGGPPWGLRFMGGDGTPVCISKIRRKSKAFNAKLQEGDEVLSVNGRNVRNVARDIAMGYVDNAMDTLDLELVRRGTGAPTIPINASSTEHMNGNTEIRRVPTYQIATAQTPRKPGVGHNKQISTTTHVETRTDGGVTEETVTKTVTERIGEEETKTTTRDVKHYGSSQDTTDTTGRLSRGNSVTFHPPKINVAAKPAIWTPPSKSQPAMKAPLAYSTSAPAHTTTAHVKYSASVQQDSPKTHGRWEPQIHYSTTPVSETDSSSTTTWSGSVSGPRRTSVGKEVTITFAPQGSPMGLMAKRTSTDSGIPPSPITPVQEEPARVSTRVDINRKPTYKEEPTVILRRAAPPEDKPDSKTSLAEAEASKRPYSYPGKHSEDDPDVSTEMRMKACKTIADLLMFPADKHAKGARMFAKRRKRSDRWASEGMGQNTEEEKALEEEEEERKKDRGVEITLVASGRRPLPPGAVPIGMPLPPPPPPPEPGKPFIPQAPPPPPPGTKYRIKVEPTNFKVNLKKKDICEHNIVNPEQMGQLVVDLKAASGRGANMFERRRVRSDKYIIDDSNVKAPPVLKKPAKPVGVSSANITMKQDIPMHLAKKSPWEAAMESPMGSCDAAFEHVQPKRPSFTQVDSPAKAHRPPPQTKPKPPAAWMATSKIVPEIPSKALSEPPKIRPKFNAADPKSAPQQETSSPVLKPKFNARRVSSDSAHGAKTQDFNPKPRGWNSPLHSGEASPASQTSMNSAEDGLSGSIFPTKAAKFSSDFNNFNRKPRGWGSSNDPPPANAATNGRPASYHYGAKPAQFSARLMAETGDL